MKIGFDAKRAFHNFSGLGNYSRDLIRHLSLHYPQNKLYLFSPKDSSDPRVSSLKELSNIHTVTPESFLNKSLPSLWRSVNLENAMKKQGIQLFHGLSNEIPKRNGFQIPFLVTIHDVIFKRFPEYYKPVDRRIYDKKWSYACENSDLIIAISEQTKRDIVEFYGVDSKKINVLYQSCHENFRKTYQAEELKKTKLKFNLPDEFVLNVGTIEPRKNLENIVKGMTEASNKVPLVVIGRKTDYFQEIKQLIHESKDRIAEVIFLENVSINDLPIIYRLASAFIYPSLFEGFGIPIIEALYSGTPVITSKDGCFSEAGGPLSRYIDPKKPSEIAHALDQVIANNNLRKEMIEAGHDYVQKFNPERLSSQLVEIYSALV